MHQYAKIKTIFWRMLMNARLEIEGQKQLREGTLNISTTDPGWICNKGSCRFSSAHWIAVAFTTRLINSTASIWYEKRVPWASASRTCARRKQELLSERYMTCQQIMHEVSSENTGMNFRGLALLSPFLRSVATRMHSSSLSTLRSKRTDDSERALESDKGVQHIRF